MEDNNKQFILCPQCGGSGQKGEFGLKCQECNGMGTGTFFHNRFFYWGPKLGRAAIELDHFRQKMQIILNMIFFSIGVIGLLSLAVWVYLASKSTAGTELFLFWRSRHILIFLFWISLIADMFVIYRLSEEERKQHKIKPLSYEKRQNLDDLPDNWDELVEAEAKIKIDVAGGYSIAANKIVEDAYLLALKMGNIEVSPLHLFFCSLADPEVGAIFSRLNVDSEKLFEKTKEYLARIEVEEGRTVLGIEAKEMLVEAYLWAYNLEQKKVSPKNLIIPAIKQHRILKEILYDLDISEEKVFNVILWFIINERQIESYRAFRKMARFKPGTNMDRAYTSIATKTLNQLGYDLTVAAKWNKLEYCVAREKEIDKVWQHLESGQNGVILVGPPGAGKNTIVDGIAQLMVKEDVPKFLQDKRLVELDATRLISGANASQAQGRMMAVINEVMRAGNIVLYIKDIENLIGITVGGEESLDLAEVLASALERKSIYCFASASQKNYSNYIEERSLGKVMAPVKVEEPEGNQAIQIIESKIGYFEGKYQVYFSYHAIEQVIEMTKKYIHDEYLPEKAIKILELVAVRVAKEKGAHAVVTREDIAAVIGEKTGIPVTKITETEGQQLLHLEDRIHQRMINQKEAVKMVSASLRRARTELREGNRPIANFLFLGPTGVGKTELAKSVSEIYFGDENYMIRVDMSEYQHPDSIKKLIGDASGAKGHLTEKVRKQPFAMVLLDEIEKAHPDILNVFLQVMDDGRLTDGQGRTIDFTNSIVIATSNAGSLYIQQEVIKGTDIDNIKTVLINEHLNKVMRPELINRFDGVIVFTPLSKENVVDICKLMLNKIGKMLQPKGIEFEVDEEGARILAAQGYDPKFGARPLRRLLQDSIEDQIANYILEGKLKRRDTVVVDNFGNVEVRKGMEI